MPPRRAVTDPTRSVTVTKIAPNLHASIDPISGVRVSADGRVDFINQFDKQFSARGAAGWRILPKLVAKIIGGRAFQTPSTVFLYAYNGFGTADIKGSRTTGASVFSLVPQTVTSGELVVNFLPNEHLSINGSGYYQSIDNQITFVTTRPQLRRAQPGYREQRTAASSTSPAASGTSSPTAASAGSGS